MGSGAEREESGGVAVTRKRKKADAPDSTTVDQLDADGFGRMSPRDLARLAHSFGLKLRVASRPKHKRATRAPGSKP